MADPLRILLLGDYSNCHRTLATGLRQLGCDVTVASDGSRWMDVDRDLDISRRPGRLGGLALWARLRWPLRSRLSGYDIVALSDPHMFQLRPARLKPLFDRLKAENRSVFLTAMSTDIAFLSMLSAPDSPLRYSEWFVVGKPSRWHLQQRSRWLSWHSPDVVAYQNHVFSNLDGAVSVLYEYQLGMERMLGKEKAAYGGIPVDTGLYRPGSYGPQSSVVRIFLGRDRSRMAVKGSDYLEEAARRVVARHPSRCSLTVVENRPFHEFTALLSQSDIVLDQIYSYTPATTALMAMAMGKTVVSGAEPDFYDFIGETANRPIINAALTVDGLEHQIERLVLSPETLADRGRASRRFVETHNAAPVVARRFLDFWTSRLNS